jgi:hypothetical protein
MQIRFTITKYRVAMAALFVLAGVGLGNLLSPLVGSALATVGQTVNISDHSASAYFAKVDSNGALKTIGTLTGGNVSISAPQSAFGFSAPTHENQGLELQAPVTNATLAFTGFRVANRTANSTTVSLYQYGQSSAAACSQKSPSRFLGEFAVPAGQTVDEQLTTPLVLKPLSGAPYWCLETYATGSSGEAFYTTYSGYVVSGNFVPPAPGPPPGSVPNPNTHATG